MGLFDAQDQSQALSPDAPLAERMRPKILGDYVGQEHLLSQGRPLRRLIEEGRRTSLVFWGPPGTGKTTLARIMARHWEAHFVEFSAVLSGVADIRRVVGEARGLLPSGRPTVLFVDEIHRFNKAQQDAFLPHVESGLITLLGATTENPSFEIISALLSRVRVLVLEPLGEPELHTILQRAIDDPEHGLGEWPLRVSDEARDHLVGACFGDARRMLTCLEVAAQSAPLGKGGVRMLDLEVAEEVVGRRSLRYDKDGEEHYNLISALHKSLRGSDPDAALYWLSRMLEAGEDPHYLLRRMVRFASEDVGLADPYALNQATAALKSFDLLGRPEGDLALVQLCVYLAIAPKSNALYKAHKAVLADVRQYGHLEVPKAIRNAPTSLMKGLGYGKDYQYPHDHPDAVVAQDYMPERLRSKRYYRPTERGREKLIGQRLRELFSLKNRLRHKENREE